MSKHMVFCFGSNTAGIHGAGAAREAYVNHGAKMRQGYGFVTNNFGNSFAIPTKDRDLKTLPMERIIQFVDGFLAFAEERPDLTFKVTRIGCGLAGLTDEDMAPLFSDAPINCLFDDAWRPWCGSGRLYWGTY